VIAVSMKVELAFALYSRWSMRAQIFTLSTPNRCEIYGRKSFGPLSEWPPKAGEL